jgi:hypothetical protein
MAETTITGLPNATTPLDGTERVPMDQNGATKDASTQDIANLAAAAITAAVAAHESAADPHSQYLTQAEGDGRYRQSATPLTDGDIPAGIARDSEVAAAIGAHEAAADPHPGYLTAAEGNAAYATASQGALAASAIQPGNPALSDARTPTAHAASHGSGGGDAITVAQSQVTGLSTALSGKEAAGAAAAAVAAHESAADPHPGYLTVAEGNATYQPLDADLTAIAALVTNTAGRSLLTLSAVPTGALVGTTDAQTTTNKTIGNLRESTFTITDAAGFEINPLNGPLQRVTLDANRTPVFTFLDGQSTKLKINFNTFALTYTGTGGPVVWVGGTAPAAPSSGWLHVEFWREGDVLHGGLVGSTAS